MFSTGKQLNHDSKHMWFACHPSVAPVYVPLPNKVLSNIYTPFLTLPTPTLLKQAFRMYEITLINIYLCVCVCVCEREREREGGSNNSLKVLFEMLTSLKFQILLTCMMVYAVAELDETHCTKL